MKNYAVTYLCLTNKRVFVEVVTAGSVGEARRDFNEIFRHGNNVILSVVGVPEV